MHGPDAPQKRGSTFGSQKGNRPSDSEDGVWEFVDCSLHDLFHPASAVFMGMILNAERLTVSVIGTSGHLKELVHASAYTEDNVCFFHWQPLFCMCS